MLSAAQTISAELRGCEIKCTAPGVHGKGKGVASPKSECQGPASKTHEMAEGEKQTLGLSALPGPKLLEQAQRQPLHACTLPLRPKHIAKTMVSSALHELSHFVRPMISPETTQCILHWLSSHLTGEHAGLVQVLLLKSQGLDESVELKCGCKISCRLHAHGRVLCAAKGRWWVD